MSRIALVATLATLAFPACGSVVELPPDPVYIVEIIPVAATLSAVGQTFRFSAMALDVDRDVVRGARFMWTSQDPTVATVDAAGTAMARGSGMTTITARADGVEASAALTVAP